MAKKQKNIIIKQGLDDWVMTYGDMMSLLLTFFVLIVSFSSMQQTKFEQAASSLHGAFGVLSTAESVITFEQPLVPNHNPTDEEAEAIYEVRSVERFLLEKGQDDQIQIEIKKDGILFRIEAPFLFESGTARLKSASLETLKKMDALFRKFPYQIRVEGHTDNVPMHSKFFDSNWELSAGRAVSVARYFQGQGMPPERISATGYGEFRPIADNATAEGREKNRRVEIFLQLKKEDLARSNQLPFEKPSESKLVTPADPAGTKPPATEKKPVRPIINPVTERLAAPIQSKRSQGAE